METNKMEAEGSDFLKQLSQVEHQTKWRQFKLKQDWQRLESRLAIMELKLDETKEMRDQYIDYLQRKYPNWRPQFKSFEDRRFHQRKEDEKLVDKLSTSKYWSEAQSFPKINFYPIPQSSKNVRQEQVNADVEVIKQRLADISQQLRDVSQIRSPPRRAMQPQRESILSQLGTLRDTVNPTETTPQPELRQLQRESILSQLGSFSYEQRDDTTRVAVHSMETIPQQTLHLQQNITPQLEQTIQQPEAMHQLVTHAIAQQEMEARPIRQPRIIDTIAPEPHAIPQPRVVEPAISLEKTPSLEEAKPEPASAPKPKARFDFSTSAEEPVVPRMEIHQDSSESAAKEPATADILSKLVNKPKQTENSLPPTVQPQALTGSYQAMLGVINTSGPIRQEAVETSESDSIEERLTKGTKIKREISREPSQERNQPLRKQVTVDKPTAAGDEFLAKLLSDKGSKQSEKPKMVKKPTYVMSDSDSDESLGLNLKKKKVTGATNDEDDDFWG